MLAFVRVCGNKYVFRCDCVCVCVRLHGWTQASVCSSERQQAFVCKYCSARMFV